MTRTTGFYATDAEAFYMAPSGRSWAVSSPDFDGIRECPIPEEATSADDLLTPEECLDYCRQVEAESGERLIES